MTTDFAAAIAALVRAEVEFVIVGAYGAVLHGSSLVTADLDICYRRTPENMRKLAEALSHYHPRLRGAEQVRFTLDARALAQGMNFTLITDLGDIDLLGSLSGVGEYAKIIDDSECVTLDGNRCYVASLSTIIESKRAAGRGKDLISLPELEALRELRSKIKE